MSSSRPPPPQRILEVAARDAQLTMRPPTKLHRRQAAFADVSANRRLRDPQALRHFFRRQQISSDVDGQHAWHITPCNAVCNQPHAMHSPRSLRNSAQRCAGDVRSDQPRGCDGGISRAQHGQAGFGGHCSCASRSRIATVRSAASSRSRWMRWRASWDGSRSTNVAPASTRQRYSRTCRKPGRITPRHRSSCTQITPDPDRTMARGMDPGARPTRRQALDGSGRPPCAPPDVPLPSR